MRFANHDAASSPILRGAARLVKRSAFNPDILCRMIIGVHFLLHSRDPEAGRAFVRDILEFPFVDIGHGWLISGMPSAEASIQPMATGAASLARHEMLSAVWCLMCDDLGAFIAMLQGTDVICTEIQETNWGIVSTIPLSSGGSIGLYQIMHATALHLGHNSQS
jgi:hypothetical protein